MGNSETAVCIVCGKKYKPCLSCQNQMKLKPWRTIADTADCYKIFLALAQYQNGYLSKEEAGRQLAQISYNKDELSEPIRNQVREILADTSF